MESQFLELFTQGLGAGSPIALILFLLNQKVEKWTTQLSSDFKTLSVDINKVLVEMKK